MNTVTNIPVPWNVGNLLTMWVTISLIRSYLLNRHKLRKIIVILKIWQVFDCPMMIKTGWDPPIPIGGISWGAHELPVAYSCYCSMGVSVATSGQMATLPIRLLFQHAFTAVQGYAPSASLWKHPMHWVECKSCRHSYNENLSLGFVAVGSSFDELIRRQYLKKGYKM
jgi:hypothetical protein